jgi:disulfide bond formation protein DsbB
MALGVGALVGFALRIGNGGKAFGIMGAFLALFGCILGNYFSLIAFASAEEQVPFFSMMNNADPAKVTNALWEDFTSISILFYALAAYEGYKFSAIRPPKFSSAPVQTPQPAAVAQTDRPDAEKPR